MNTAQGAAPRVTMADIEASIAHTHYFTAAQGVAGEGSTIVWHKELGLLTFCVLVLNSGFTVTGESACVSAENFDAQIGRDIARANAIEKMWPLMGFALKQKIHDQENSVAKIAQAAADAQANRPTQNCVFKFCPDEADCRANGCSMGAAPDTPKVSQEPTSGTVELG